jgi:Right handed beta helix region
LAHQALCVQAGKARCYPTLQAALDAAHDGDTVKLGAGTFTGGVAITKSISLIGAGPGATAISGGGPVLTIGVADAATEPTVSISGLTITRGENHGDGPVAQGGGIAIPPAAGFTTGATVKITHSVISGNRAEPAVTVSSPGGAVCPDGPCPFAAALGGGIYNTGNLTISNSVIADNLAAGVASDADGGGIWSALGTLTITNSVVTRNSANASVPNGRFAEGGGLFVDSGSLSVRNSVVSDNGAHLTTAWPVLATDGPIEMNANSGGIHVGDDTPTRIANTTISGNSVSAVDPVGEPVGFDAAMLIGSGTLTMRNTSITGNHVTETVATTADFGPGGSALELDGGGTIANTEITGNDMTSTSPTGDSAVAGALAVFTFNDDPQLVTVKDSVISGNTATASSPSGSATVHGVGIFNNSLLDLRHVQVDNNSANATGLSGEAQGGGIWNGVQLSGPPVTLTLEGTSVTRNALTGSAGIDLAGGGLFTTEPVTLTHSLIARNAPDQCSGC